MWRLAEAVTVIVSIAGCRSGAASVRPSAAVGVVNVVSEAGAVSAERVALPRIDWAAHELGNEGCFVLRDVRTGEQVVSDSTRCGMPRRPYSTFKVPNALIGIELGILDGPDAKMIWDRDKYPPEEWWSEDWKQDQTLRSAIKISAVPVFRRLATQVGHERMQSYLHKLAYGNGVIGERQELDHFWLDGPIRITAVQQVAFMTALACSELPLSKKAQETLHDVLLRERRGKWVLRHKTGSGPVETSADLKGPGIAWLVGWIAHQDRTLAFATWAESTAGLSEARKKRQRIVERIWTELGIPPALDDER